VPSWLKPKHDVYPPTPALRLGLVTVLSFDWAHDEVWIGL